jgi:hypothetical protein
LVDLPNADLPLITISASAGKISAFRTILNVRSINIAEKGLDFNGWMRSTSPTSRQRGTAGQPGTQECSNNPRLTLTPEPRDDGGRG